MFHRIVFRESAGMMPPYSLSTGGAQPQALVAAAAAAALVPAAWLLHRYYRVALADASTYDAKATDPSLLQRNSQLRSFTTSRYTYPSIRLFYRRHPQASKLPQLPAPLPLLVFIHGLGGSVAQFHPLLHSLTSSASCLAIDLPGCGRSGFAPRDWDAYTTDALVELLHDIIEQYRDVHVGQPVVLVGHSMGCSLAALLANPVRTADRPRLLSQHVAALVAICPSAGPPTEELAAGLRKLLWVPNPVFNLWRAWDRRGGLESPSVRRYVGDATDAESKKLQHLFNHQSRTPVWRRMVSGLLPTKEAGTLRGGLPTAEEVWAGLAIPVFLVSGASDHITPPAAAKKILACLQRETRPSAASMTSSQPEAPSSFPPSSTQLSEHPSRPSGGPKLLVHTAERRGEDQPMSTEFSSSDSLLGPSRLVAEAISDIRDEHFVRPGTPRDMDDQLSEGPVTPNDKLPAVPPQPLRPDKYCEHVTLPAPATHALLYTPRTARVLAGLISNFLTTRVTGRLSLGWQLQYLSQDGKWDVKNLEKWKKVAPISEPITATAQFTGAGLKKVVPGPITFRVMKTFREVDDTHCPREFARNWGGVVKDVIDISHDMPVYDPTGLEQAGIRYYKFPTLSKVPPTNAEIEGFIDLVDEVRVEQYKRAEQDGRTASPGYAIGVHCHYGFNRSGFFVVCYLVERCGMTAQEAIDLFAEKRPKGIKHAHFKDRLCLRYSGVTGEDP